MNHLWENLLKQAIIGTENGFTIPKAPEPLNQLLQQVNSFAVEEQFLHTTALLNQYLQNGLLPEKQSKKKKQEICEKETLPLCSQKAISYLRMILRDERQRSSLLGEWIRLAAESNQRVPHDLVVALLEKGKSNKELQKHLSICVGKRGHWLASLNSEWHYLPAEGVPKSKQKTKTKEDQYLWEEGRFQERVAYLKSCRQETPEKAIELLKECWSSEPVKNRRRFVEVLETNLSPKDEAFLESCLKDRGQQVRDAAICLLGSNANFKFTQKWLTQIATILTIVKKQKTQSLDAKLPEKFDKEWEKAGLKEKIPADVYVPGKFPSKSKEKDYAWWLYQMLRLVRPSFIAEKLSLSLEKLLALAQKSSLKDLFAEAFCNTAILQRDSEFAILYTKQDKPKNFFQNLELFEKALSPLQLEELLLDYIKAEKSKAFKEPYILSNVLKQFKEGVSVTLTKEILSVVLPPLLKEQKRDYYYLKEYLRPIATSLAADCFEEAEKRINTLKATKKTKKNESANEYYQEAIDEFLNTYQFRHQMKKEFSS